MALENMVSRGGQKRAEIKIRGRERNLRQM